MKNISMNQFNDLWRNCRLTIVTIIFPILGGLLLLYMVCRPFHNWVDNVLENIFYKLEYLKNKKKEDK